MTGRIWAIGWGLALAGLATSGCNLPGLGGKGVPAVVRAARPAGQWQNTQIQYQVYEKFQFRDKKTGKVIEPDATLARPDSEIDLEPQDYEELTYFTGRLRYTLYVQDEERREAQPFSVERTVTEPEFEALDQALYDDKYLSLEERNWDATKRIPMFVLTYVQGQAGYRASFAPSMGAKLPRTTKVIAPYIAQLSAAEKPPAGVSHTSYAFAPVADGLQVSVNAIAQDKNGDVTSTPLNLDRVDFNIGAGVSAAKLGPKANQFVMTQPPTKGTTYLTVELAVTPKGGTLYKTVIPVRAKS